jgi:AraC family transcriptional regulator of adaptative response / DNA-3-methyladenine glycosylase II
VAEHLRRDRVLAPFLRVHPGLRLPGAFDGFEIATRAVLGQQVSVAGARTLAGRLVERFGSRLDAANGTGAGPGLERLYPTAAELAAAPARELAAIGLPAARAGALAALARAVDGGALSLDPPTDPDALQRGLRELPGFGAWTASYVAMRALGWPDAFLEGDLVVRRALGDLSPRACVARAEAWRPWRAYAVMHLWASQGRKE